MHRDIISVGGAFHEGRPLGSGIVTSGRILFTSGLTSTDEEGNVVGIGDMAAQVKHAFGRLKSILDKVGADFSHVIKYNVFVTDMKAYFAAKASGEFYVNKPASCLIEVKGLARPECMVEVEAIVALD